MTDVTHAAPCPGPDAHRTATGAVSCMGHAKHSNTERQAAGKQPGMPCRKPPVRGLDVCATHGGNAGHARAAGQRRQQEAALERAVVTLGLPRQIDPGRALLEEVWRTAGHIEWLGERIRELEDSQMTWGVKRVKTGGDDHGTTEQAGPPVFYELYARERAHLVKVSAEAIRVGIEERHVRLAEQQGAAVAEVIRRSLDGILAALVAAGLTEALRAVWAAAVVEVVPRELRAIAGGGGA